MFPTQVGTDYERTFGVLRPGEQLQDYESFVNIYKGLWADNGDVCSVQYAGTPALKSDFTRPFYCADLGHCSGWCNPNVAKCQKENFGPPVEPVPPMSKDRRPSEGISTTTGEALIEEQHD
ncbi:hypothetical protein M514_07167 [Trichuris suis]|uniref:Uncharacterized protein n=1 Tax=Trichuris suis TaxID=68888 RepID=A0A085NBY2_9BILA|nr:hypothetical protein M513_07167 [Trichuris suis]KFD66978.1 hypothetical protein M514_07167 [Trichuris suis]